MENNNKYFGEIKKTIRNKLINCDSCHKKFETVYENYE